MRLQAYIPQTGSTLAAPYHASPRHNVPLPPPQRPPPPAQQVISVTFDRRACYPGRRGPSLGRDQQTGEGAKHSAGHRGPEHSTPVAGRKIASNGKGTVRDRRESIIEDVWEYINKLSEPQAWRAYDRFFRFERRSSTGQTQAMKAMSVAQRQSFKGGLLAHSGMTPGRGWKDLREARREFEQQFALKTSEEREIYLNRLSLAYYTAICTNAPDIDEDVSQQK